MATRSLVPRLTDIVEAIERVRHVLGHLDLDAFEADLEKQWLEEQGVEIVSEASRHLTLELKARHPDIPWKHVADIGNVPRRAYQNVAPPVMWSLVRDRLPPLERACIQMIWAATAARSSNTTVAAQSAVPSPHTASAASPSAESPPAAPPRTDPAPPSPSAPSPDTSDRR